MKVEVKATQGQGSRSRKRFAIDNAHQEYKEES